MRNRALRLIIADDHTVVRMGLKAILAEHPIRFKLVAEVTNGEELLAALQAIADVDVVVTDFAMSRDGHDGLRLLQRLRVLHPNVNIVVLTMLNNAALLQSIHNLGIQCIISKGCPNHSVCQAIEKAARHLPLATGEATDFNISSHPDHTLATLKGSTLSPREVETLRLLLTGLGVSEIARTLHRSKKTISAQKHAAMVKLGLENDAQLFRYLYDRFER